MKKGFFNIIPSKGEVAVLLYGDVGEGCPVDSSQVVRELMLLAEQYGKIDVRINSRGGDVFSGVAIYNALRACTADITIYVDGLAGSIAGIIALCGKPLYLSPYARLMLHRVSAGTYGDGAELRRVATLVEELEDTLAQMIAGRLKMDKEQVISRYFDGADHWISAREAVDMGLADGLYSLESTPAPAPKTEEEIYQFFNRIHQSDSQNYMNMNILQQIKSIPSFKDVEDGQLVAHLAELANELCALREFKSQVEAERVSSCQKKIEALTKSGVLTATQAEGFKNLVKVDAREVSALLSSFSRPAVSVPKASAVFQGDNRSAVESMSWDELDKAGKLLELKNTDLETFKEKFKAHFGMDYNG